MELSDAPASRVATLLLMHATIEITLIQFIEYFVRFLFEDSSGIATKSYASAMRKERDCLFYPAGALAGRLVQLRMKALP